MASTVPAPASMAGSSRQGATGRCRPEPPRQRGAGIDVLDEDVRRVTGQHVPQSPPPTPVTTPTNTSKNQPGRSHWA